jgi:hypothetical protein
MVGGKAWGALKFQTLTLIHEATPIIKDIPPVKKRCKILRQENNP